MRKALGRGLEALIPGPAAVAEARTRLAEVDVDRIRPNPQQPRDHFDDAAIDRIAGSLERHGVLQPIVVREAGRGYELIAGERRWRAAQRAGIERIPAVIRNVTASESLELALVENLQREDLNAIEEAQAYRMLVEEMGLTQEEAAVRVGRDRSTVANYIRLLHLPSRVQAWVSDGSLSMGHARALLGLQDRAAQRRLAEEVISAGLSVRQTEARVRAVGSGSGAARRPGRAADPDTQAAEERLSRAVGAPVRIRGKESGRVEIRFTSLDELNRLYDMFLELGGER